MENLIYLMTVGIIYGALYLIYFALFRNNTNFQTNRIYLLSILPLSFILPNINLDTDIITQFQVLLPAFDTINTTVTESSNINWINLLTYGYLTICITLLLNLFIHLFKTLSTISNIKNGNLKNISPFSFFSFIYVPKDLDSSDREAITNHEKVHSTQLHSIDILLYEISKIILWWNPFIWMGLQSVKSNHEFIADKLASENADKYSSVLVAQLLGVNCSALANNFKSKPLIKKRIMMMKTKKSNQLSVLKYALVIPVIAASVMISNGNNLNDKVEPINELPSYQKNDLNLSTNSIKIGEVDKMPEFKGGKSAMMTYLINNIKYPKAAEKENAEGTVFVSFIVDEKGNVKNTKVRKSVHTLLDSEAIRVIAAMPQWTPGNHEGENVSVEMSLPIKFQLKK